MGSDPLSTSVSKSGPFGSSGYADEIGERNKAHRDAVIVEEIEQRWSYRSILISLAALLILSFPIVFGGRSAIAVRLVEVALFASGVIFSLSLFRTRPLTLQPVVLGLPLLVVALQLLPLSSSTLSAIGLSQAVEYQASGVGVGAISVDRAVTMDSLLWGIALLTYCLVIAGLPPEADDRRWLLSRSKRRARGMFATDRHADLLMRVIVLAGVICSLLALSHWALRTEELFGLFTGGRGPIISERAHWPFVNPDHLVVLLEMSAALCMTRLLVILRAMSGNSERRGREGQYLTDSKRLIPAATYVVFLVVILLGVLLSLSRAGIALTVVGLLGLVVLASRVPSRLHILHTRARSQSSRLRTLVSAVTFALLLMLLLGGTGRELLTERLRYGLAAGYDEMRHGLNVVSLRVFQFSPLLGVGLGCWNLVAPRFMSPSLAAWEIEFAHNDYLQFLAEVGVVGALLALIFPVLVIRRTWRAYRVEQSSVRKLEICGASMALLLPAIHALVDFPFHIPALALIYVVLLACQLRLIETSMQR